MLGRPTTLGRNELLTELEAFFGLSILKGRGQKARINIADAMILKKFLDDYKQLKARPHP
jgi:hypothetical protein